MSFSLSLEMMGCAKCLGDEETAVSGLNLCFLALFIWCNLLEIYLPILEKLCFSANNYVNILLCIYSIIEGVLMNAKIITN